ncbi:barstar family protein [Streptomyces sp. NBC_00239]|uniref:barstar family protein n=1 Tax=Streptomyces sp. NBC_00239 TaxID=2903640 RepID=UPI002E28DF14|nr:barstar family protein [Streptomyces sp. NBC_00239]
MTLDPQPLAPALAAAREAGRTVVVLDLDGVRTKAALMERCARALELPQWFGRNWDALADVLTDPSWFPAQDARVLLAVTEWRGYAQARPQDWEVFREVLESAAEYWESAPGGTSGHGATAEAGPAAEAEPEAAVTEAEAERATEAVAEAEPVPEAVPGAGRPGRYREPGLAVLIAEPGREGRGRAI